MFALAVIEREMRVRTRRPVTSWMRVLVGVAASITAITTLNWQSRFSGAQLAGKQMFATVTWMAFALCMIEGARCASDAVSRERREGTLGLLLLTRLSGFEVALGKCAAASLTSVYVLLAVFPAMAIALAVGGVTAGEFWRTQAVLVNTLFLAVAAAMWVSARSLDDSRALLGTLGLLTLLTLGPGLLRMHARFAAWPNLSPGVVMTLADAQHYATAPRQFWTSFIAVQLLGWALMWTAGVTIVRAWRSESNPHKAAGSERVRGDVGAPSFKFPPSLHARRAITRQQLLETDPVEWLESRRDDLRGLVWLALLLPTSLELGMNLLLRLFNSSPAVGGMLTGAYFAVSLSAQLMLGFVACRRFAEERAAGTLELLLSTEVAPRQIALAHWRALWKLVRLPLVVSVAAPIALQSFVMAGQRWSGGGGAFSSILLFQLFRPLLHVANVLAVCWLGMWLGVRATSALRAVGLTILWTMLAPYLAQSLVGVFVSFLYNPAAASTSPWWAVYYWLSWLGSCAYSLAVLFWARNRLLTRLRQGATDTAPPAAVSWNTSSRT